MQFAVSATTPAAPAVGRSATSGDTSIAPVGEGSAWTNPAAAAALLSSVEMLRAIEDGIVHNYQEPERVRGFAVDLRSTSEIFETASQVILGDASKENDAFLPLITAAGGGVLQAESRLSSKDLATTWPSERNDILSSIRRARSISQNVAEQLDPRSSRPR